MVRRGITVKTAPITITIDNEGKQLVSRNTDTETRAGVIVRQGTGRVLLVDLLVGVNGAITLAAQSADAGEPKTLFSGLVKAGDRHTNDDAGIAELQIRATAQPITGLEMEHGYITGYRIGFFEASTSVAPHNTFAVRRSAAFVAGYRAGAAEYLAQFMTRLDRAVAATEERDRSLQ